ncbi:hypothetical protein M413DRAFT_191011 [Hebeloma cylindrosporum]|uniref:Uncharacterized protein n=1 Tax=Hebeloma cylindrosporum TaxID=76867 RepID=A0A0C3C593_HEBCY|nr:hypothetical protein M413DRAFT_191011 [Hebeloma cylindrosporum h7]
MPVLLWDTVINIRLPSSHPVLHTSHLLRDASDSSFASWDATLRPSQHGHRRTGPNSPPVFQSTRDPVLPCRPHPSRVSTGYVVPWGVDLVRSKDSGGGMDTTFGERGIWDHCRQSSMWVLEYWVWIMCFRALKAFRLQREYYEYRWAASIRRPEYFLAIHVHPTLTSTTPNSYHKIGPPHTAPSNNTESSDVLGKDNAVWRVRIWISDQSTAAILLSLVHTRPQL